jgi:hypothetical protein
VEAKVEERDVSDWGGFENELQSLRVLLKDSPTKLLFRGQSDSEFRLTTTLERNGCEEMGFLDYYQLTTRIKPSVESLTPVRWDLPEPSGEFRTSFRDPELLTLLRFPSVVYYSYMVYLRHNGFPSPLLDWSHSPFVAAFFAFRDLTTKSKKRSIYVYCEMPLGIKSSNPGAPAIRPIGHYVRSHPRHFRQQADYTICGRRDNDLGWVFCQHEPIFRGRDRQDLLWKFNLPSSECVNVLRALDDHNLNAFSLFDSDESLLETMWVREHILKRPRPREAI